MMNINCLLTELWNLVWNQSNIFKKQEVVPFIYLINWSKTTIRSQRHHRSCVRHTIRVIFRIETIV